MKALVTGATGFIGSALASALVEAGWHVNVLIRPNSRNKLAGAERFEVFEADLTKDRARLREAVVDSEVVFHAAALRDRWGTTIQDYYQVNVEGTRRLLEASIGRARRFVHLSSVGVFGKHGLLGINENFPLYPPSDKVGYHGSKAESERIVQAKNGEIETVIVRPTIIYGPGDQDGMLPRLIDLIARGKFVRIGQGGNHFHLTYIDDLVHGLIQAAIRPDASGQTFILAGKESIAVGEFITMIEMALGRSPSRLYLPESLARPVAEVIELLYQAVADLRILGLRITPPVTPDKIDTLCIHRGFSYDKAKCYLGYTPRVDYEEGLARTLKWMAESGRLHFTPAFSNSATHTSKVI